MTTVHRLRVQSAARRTGRTRLTGSAVRYLRSVLRLGPGDRIEVFDGEGGAFLAEITAMSASSAELSLVGAVERASESPLSLTLAVAVAKGAKLDWVVEKATELGVSRIVPFVSERTVPDRDFGARTRRWRRIAEAAAAQSRRSRCPDVEDVGDFSTILGLASRCERALFFWERCGDSPDFLVDGPIASAAVVTGPEGGFTDAEADAARAAGFVLATLGPRILRAETAAVAAIALAQHRWGDLWR